MGSSTFNNSAIEDNWGYFRWTTLRNVGRSSITYYIGMPEEGNSGTATMNFNTSCFGLQTYDCREGVMDDRNIRTQWTLRRCGGLHLHRYTFKNNNGNFLYISSDGHIKQDSKILGEDAAGNQVDPWYFIWKLDMMWHYRDGRY